jgi:hypothetical protein
MHSCGVLVRLGVCGFGEDKTAGTMDAQQHAADEGSAEEAGRRDDR